MKKTIQLILACLLCLAMTWSAPIGLAEEGIVFSDTVLEQKIREAIGIPDGPITPEDAARLDWLDASGEENTPDNERIHDISALRAFTNLTGVRLNFQAIKDICCFFFHVSMDEDMKIGVSPFSIEITEVKLRDHYNTKVFSVQLKNHSADKTIDAFTLAHKCYDTYGELLSATLLNPGGIDNAEWWKELSIEPGKTFSMGSYFWYLFSAQTCTKIDVAVSKYHTTDGVTVTIPTEDYVWVTGKLK